MKLLPDGRPSLLPTAISLGECKGNAGGQRDLCTVANPLAHREKLSEEARAAIDGILRFSDHLAQAYTLKEQFYWFLLRQTARRQKGGVNDGS